MIYVELKLKKQDSNLEPLSSYKNAELPSRRGLYSWMGKNAVMQII